MLLDRVGWSALRFPPFRAFIGSMLLSTTGNFIYLAALGWYVVEVTGSAAAVGLTFAVFGAPTLLLTAQAGVLTDRYGSQRMLTFRLWEWASPVSRSRPSRSRQSHRSCWSWRSPG